MSFWAGVYVVEVSKSNIFSEGIGALSTAVRDVCMAVHRVFDFVGYGACCRRGFKIGVKASCKTCAAWSRVRRRYLFLYSICRCGELPFIYGRCARQNGQRSICS